MQMNGIICLMKDERCLRGGNGSIGRPRVSWRPRTPDEKSRLPPASRVHSFQACSDSEVSNPTFAQSGSGP